jgi:transcriptional antiterminator RfaH
LLNTNCTENASTGAGRQWFAFKVRPRHEKKVALQLEVGREECFLPLIRHARNWAKRTVHVDLPLIPGYVFCRSQRFGLLPILKTPGVVDVVRIGNSPAPIPNEEINALERTLSAHVPVEPYPFIETGQTVTICNGPLTGVSGIVTERRKANQLIISITLLRRSVLVHVDENALMLANDRHQVA